MNNLVHMADAGFPYNFSSRNLGRSPREGTTHVDDGAITTVGNQDGLVNAGNRSIIVAGNGHCVSVAGTKSVMDDVTQRDDQRRQRLRWRQ